LAWYQAIGQPKGEADTQRYLADLALTLGQYEAARERLTAVLETYRAIQDKRSVGTTLTRLSLVHHYLGDEQTAVQQAEAALAIAAEVGNPLLRAYGLSSLGHGLRGQGEWERATAVYTEAIALWGELGMTSLKVEAEAALATIHFAAERQVTPGRCWERPLTTCSPIPNPIAKRWVSFTWTASPCFKLEGMRHVPDYCCDRQERRCASKRSALQMQQPKALF
jgi:tetratricopeptide (TPR) repeat protein